MKSTSRLRVLSDRIPRVLGVYLFLQGVIRKYGRKAHTSELHRDINVPRNYLTSRRLQKPREESGGRTGLEAGARPPALGARPDLEANQDSVSREISTDLKDQE